MAEVSSEQLRQIWQQSPDLQKEFPVFGGKGISGNWSIYDWAQKYPQDYQTRLSRITGTAPPAIQLGAPITEQFDYKKWGISDSLWNSIDDATKAFIESSAKLLQTQYDQGVATASINSDLLNKALNAAQTDPDIVAKYGDAAKINTATLQSNLAYINTEYAQQSGLTAATQEQERKQLAETEAEAGRAYSGFREQAKNLLAQQQTGVIESARRTLQQQVQQQGRAYEQVYGTTATTALGPITAGGETYSPLGEITGTEPLAKKADIYSKGLQSYQMEALT